MSEPLPAYPGRRCRHCGRVYQIRKDGELRAHFLSLAWTAGLRCPGGFVPRGDGFRTATTEEAKAFRLYGFLGRPSDESAWDAEIESLGLE